MKYSILYIAIAFSMTTLLGSCSEKPVANDTISFSVLSGKRTFRLENSAQDFDRDRDIQFTDSARLMIPTDIFGQDITPLRDAILTAAFDTVAEPHIAMETFFKNTAAESGYNIATDTDNDDNADDDGFSYVEGNVISLTSDRLTYRISNYLYMPGAAHGLNINTFIVYSISNSKLLTLNDIFTPEGLKALPTIIAGKAKDMKAAIGPTNISALPAGDNFYIDTDDNIVFVYAPYEVASYAQGEIAIAFYPYQLAEYLSPEALALFNLVE